jgi:hypothetical protein
MHQRPRLLVFFFIQGLKLCDLLVRFLRVNHEKASTAAPISSQNHHLHIASADGVALAEEWEVFAPLALSLCLTCF